uniref:Uncharacterized protein n=1 Tax=Arundo donax TaxID=35708 RepID=A0A0A9H6L0_ARUDO
MLQACVLTWAVSAWYVAEVS